MSKIFCLMGKSSSGKDTIFKALIEDESLKLRHIVPYTTRPIRAGEQNGVEYFFTDDEGCRRLEEAGKIIERRVYHTYHGEWSYFTVADNQIDLEHQDYLVIGTLESYEKMRDYFGEQHVCPILIELDDGIRLQRALDRERGQEQPKYEELCRRFLADAKDFDEEKIRSLALEARFHNEKLDACIAQIKEYIRKKR